MSVLTKAEDLEFAGAASADSRPAFRQAFEAWYDPPAFEPGYDDLAGDQFEPEGLDEGLELRISSL